MTLETFIYKKLQSTGSTWIIEEDLLNAFKKVKVDVDLDYLAKSKKLVKYRNYYTLPKIADEEDAICNQLMKMVVFEKQTKFPEEVIERFIDESEKELGCSLHSQQRNAVRIIATSGVSILTGGPGTGKTFTLNTAIRVIRKMYPDIKVEMTAPTGKAARRITESTGEFATTIHKKLGVTKTKKKANRYEGDCLVIDESSMLDNEIMAALLNSFPMGKRLILVGDTEQLPSVGIGAILRDLIASEVIKVGQLTKTFRQDNSSVLFQNIQKIKNGEYDLVEGPDFKLQKAEHDTKAQITNQIVESVEKWGLENVVTLIPYRQRGLNDVVCSETINLLAQKKLNLEKSCYRKTFKRNYGDYVVFFKKGDYVMQLENRKECANGDIGIIRDVGVDGIEVEFIDCTVHYYPDDLEQLSLAYSMSIHKSQGSEYPCVIMVLLNEHKQLLQRNMLYTGITRAKKECILIYDEDALKLAVKTVADDNRVTFLQEKLKALSFKYQLAGY